MRTPRLVVLVAAASLAACAGGCGAATRPPAEAPERATPAGSATPTTMAPRPPTESIRAQHLRVPAIGIDAPVGSSTVVPDTSVPPPGCPAPPPGSTTFTVPERGIVTPEEPIPGIEDRVWIFGHSRWQNEAGVLFRLQDLNNGDEVIVDGTDRRTGEVIRNRRFVVDGIYLTDIDSGGGLVTTARPTDDPARAVVVLQTSARADGAGAAWILDRTRIMSKAQNLIEGDVNDPCKYLLLFVFARPA